jgi:hypothetical protein
MSLPVDETQSRAIAEQIKSKARKPFDNAHRAALEIQGAVYVQGFLVYASKPYRLIEHAWLEVAEQIVDPNLPHLNKKAADLTYFPAQRLTVKQLKDAIEEAKEDYPDDDPLPIYGTTPYEYYGDVMLGGKEYAAAYEAAEAKCKALAQNAVDLN